MTSVLDKPASPPPLLNRPTPPKPSSPSKGLKWLVIALVIIALIEGLVIFQQHKVSKEIEAQSARMLNKFLQSDAGQPDKRVGVPIRLQNVKFQWSKKVFINTGEMAVEAVPISGTMVNFDNLDSFLLNVHKSDVLVRPSVLEGMFNESVFNYPGSKLRDLKVTIVKNDQKNLVKLTGSLDFILWIPFEMLTRLDVDKATNTLLIDVQDLKILGFIPANALIKLRPFNLEKMISLPANQYLTVRKNEMLVKPFGLFPPPRINGKIDEIVVGENMIRLSFAGEPLNAPRMNNRNYVYVKGGQSKFGNFQMNNTDILVTDANPNDPFAFSLQKYADLIPKSTVLVKDTHSARVTMPDYTYP